MQTSSSRKGYDRKCISDLADQTGGPLPVQTSKRCYQCNVEVRYLFDDGRCGGCTRLTPEEVRGDEQEDS